MSATGLQERAAGLAVLLSPLRQRHAAADESQGLNDDFQCRAASVLADLLGASRKEAPLSRDEADAVLQETGYDLKTFENRSWLRWVLGRFEIPMGVGVAIAGVERNRVREGLVEDELRALLPIRRRVYSYADAKPTLPKAEVEAIFARHNETSALEDLQRDGALKIREGEVELELRATVWSAVGDRIAAILWTRGPDAGDLAGWMGRIPGAWWIRAPEHLAEGPRAKLLDAMVQAVETDVDLKTWVEEVRHIAPDVGDPGRQVRQVHPPVATQLGRYGWWKHLRVGGGRCRERLGCLVASVVRHDSASGQHPLARVRKLLSLAAEKAWLALVVPEDLLHARPEALASLCVDSENSVLAMSLLDSLWIPETSWDTANESDARRERYRSAIWRELLSLFVAGLCSRGETSDDAAKSAIELLAYLERRSTQGGFLMAPDRREIYDEEVRARIAMFTAELAKAKLPYKESGRRPRYLPRALPTLALAMRRTLGAEPDSARRLSLLFWMFELAVDEVAHSLASDLARTIADELVGWLNRDVEHGAIDAWFDEELPIADLPWHKILLANRDAANQVIDRLVLHGKDVDVVLASVVRRDDDDRDDEFAKYQLNSTLVRKRRLHLLLLLRALERLPAASRVVAQPLAELIARVQERLHRFLSDDAAESTNVFTGTPYLPASPELLTLTLHAIEKLPAELRQRVLADWILKSDDPFLVLGILAETHSHSLRMVAEARYSLINWEAYFEEQTWWATMFSLARMAIAAGKLGLADTILSKDTQPERRDEQSFVPRLMLAAVKGEPVEDIPLPRDPSLGSRDLAQFYSGLRDLGSRPSEAVHAFQGLIHRGAHVAESAVNLFLARLRLASELGDKEEQVASIASALGEFRETASTLDADALQRVSWDAHQNELYALHQIGLRDEFWRLWHDLPLEQRASEPFVRVALAASADQGEDAVRSLLVSAAEFHGNPAPSWLLSLRLEAAEGKQQTLSLPRMAMLSDDDIRVVLSEGQRRPIASRAVIFGSIPDADVDGFLLELHLNAARELMKLEVVVGQIAEEDKLSDFMTAFLRSACRGMNITVHQQERGGRSGSDERKTDRGGVGERDWTVQADAVEVAVVEALQLPNGEKDVWHHLKKLLERYDRAGLPRAFMVLYVRSDDFDTVLTDYQEAVRTWAASEAQLVGDVEMHSKDAAYLQVLKSVHRRGENATTTVFHILVRVERQ